jgi:ATP-dependent HslUV protease ATP-binding subunit HslU
MNKNEEIFKESLTPKEIVKNLDKYIIGQNKAKKAISVAIRNRFRRMCLEDELKNEILPKNILMMGPTGVGKTEIARRMAMILNAPFVKVEATKFTEIGYVGRNVESMVRDLVAESVRLIKKNKEEVIKEQAEKTSINKITEILITQIKKEVNLKVIDEKNEVIEMKQEPIKFSDIKKRVLSNYYDEYMIEIETKQGMDSMSSIGMISATSDLEEINMNIKEMVDSVFSKKNKKRKITVAKAKKIFAEEEIEKLLDMEEICELALQSAENTGIIFIDEIDKIIANNEGAGSGRGPNVSREGVQRDFLPIVEGTTVKTKYGNIKTDHILFIAAGAFHLAKPSDLIPELQGRFPIRVELDSLRKDDFKKILVDPKNSLIKQYKALLGIEKINLEFREKGIEKIAEYCDDVNKNSDNIGARRLYAMLEKLVEDISFNADEYENQTVEITAEFVKNKLDNIIENKDLSKYIL